MVRQPVRRVPWLSWGLVGVVATVVALLSLWVAFTPAGDQTSLSGRTWAQFASQDPEVAGYFARQLFVMGMLGAGFGLIAALVSFNAYRRGQRWAWYALWLLALAIGAIAARQLAEGYGSGSLYAVLAAAAAIGLLISVRTFAPGRGRDPATPPSA